MARVSSNQAEALITFSEPLPSTKILFNNSSTGNTYS